MGGLDVRFSIFRYIEIQIPREFGGWRFRQRRGLFKYFYIAFAFAFRAILRVIDLSDIAQAATFRTEGDWTEVLGRNPSWIIKDGIAEVYLVDMDIDEAVLSLAFVGNDFSFVELEFLSFVIADWIVFSWTCPHIHVGACGDKPSPTLRIHRQYGKEHQTEQYDSFHSAINFGDYNLSTKISEKNQTCKC